MPPRCRFRLTPISFLVGMIATSPFHSSRRVLSAMGTYTCTAIAASVSLPIFARKSRNSQYQLTAALWQRAFLQYDYGVLPREIHWYTGGLTSPDQLEPNAIQNLPGITIDLIPDSKTLEASLAEGELSALFSPNRPAALLNGSGRIRRLFPNTVRSSRSTIAAQGFSRLCI